MKIASEVAADEVLAAVRGSVQDLYKHDGELVRKRAHERSVMFHVGRRLADTVDDWGDGWHVDVDYNRAVDPEEVEWVKKYLPATAGRKAGAVFPDLIVHRRGSNTPEVNLLVMECKFAPTNRSVDYGKLRAYQELYGYRFAAYLEFPQHAEPPRLLWCEADTESAWSLGEPKTTPPAMW